MSDSNDKKAQPLAQPDNRQGTRPDDARRAVVAAGDEEDTPRDGEDPTAPHKSAFVGRVFAKSIVGDIFSSGKNDESFASLAYRSRMIDRADLTNITKQDEVVVEEDQDTLANSQDLVESDRWVEGIGLK
jgi:hypothetical protein